MKEIMTTISIRISKEEKEKLQTLAKDSDSTMSQIVRKAIKQFLSE